jgi:peptidase C39-like protein/FG-GAP repeat protein
MGGTIMKKYIITLTTAFSVFFAGLLPVSAGILNVPVIYQSQEQWCWAASSQMILSYYGTSTAQCTMANYCFSQSSCCNNVVWPNGTGSYCNQPNWVFGYGKDMAEVLSVYGGISGTGYYSALAWSTLVSEINGGHPFVIGFSWTSGGGHALVGRGYSGSYGYYNDPWPGEGYMYASYSWMVSASDHVWDESYTTRSSGGSSDYRVLAGGDYNGDGRDDIAIFRPSSGLWSIRGVTRVYWGTSGDIPVPANYGGYGKTDIGIFRPSSGLWALQGYIRYYYGSSSDIPVPGDYNGNGACNLGIYRPSSGLWSLRGFTRCYFGGSSDTAVPANFQGGSADDIAIFRPSSGLWAIRGGNRYYFGRSGDIPVTR